MKRALILGVLCTLISFSSITEANSIKYLAETTTDGTSIPGGNEGQDTGTNHGDVNQVESANPEVRLDGAIGPWEPNNKDMPNFDNIKEGDLIGTKPNNDKLFKISVTVPLNMEFMVVNKKEDGTSVFGKFVSPYHYITNNGTYPLDVSFESFDKVTSNSSSDGLLSISNSEQVAPLYIEEPVARDRKVQMRLSLNYDRPQQGTYLKTIDLHTLNKNRTSEENKLGEIGSNETARIYYRSDLWETPFSEGITEDVVSNFNLILSFSTKNTNVGTGNEAGGSAGTGSEGNASSTPSSGNITSGGSNEGADSGSGSTGSGENSALQNPSES